MYLTYRYRLKDGNRAVARELRRQAGAVNFVWNYLVETDWLAAQRWRQGGNGHRHSVYDLEKLTAGSCTELGLHSDTVKAVCKQFVVSRERVFPRTPSFRSGKRNLGWVPCSQFARGNGRIAGDAVIFRKRSYRVWLSRPFPAPSAIKAFSFGRDSGGRWFLNLLCKIADAEPVVGPTVGIDLGLKDLAALSTGEKIENPRYFRASAERHALAQRRKQKARARKIAAKIARQRRHFAHVQSARIAREFGLIRVGDVSPSALKRTRMAKSVSDAGWTMFRDFLRYKAIAQGKRFEIVNEAYSSVTCSECGSLSGPKGREGLRVRQWTCEDCGSVHDRDVNAARNIAGLKHQPLSEGSFANAA